MSQPFYKKASVQVAIITGIFAILIAIMNIWYRYSETNIENIKLNEKIEQKNEDLKKSDAKINSQEREIQRLETLLTPFRTIALEKYTGTESEALSMLANKIEEFQLTIIEKTKKIQELEENIKKLETASLPRTISVEKFNTLTNLLSFNTDFQIGIICKAFDTESCNYADQIKNVFLNAKWHVAPINKSFLGDIESDIGITVTNTIQVETANKIKDALNSANIICNYEKIREHSISGIKENTIYLIIGSKLKDKS